MDKKQLEYFITIAKYHNFSKAADDFYISQPALTHQIKTLEKELGCSLFIRNTRVVALTTCGEIFLEEAKKIVSLMDTAIQKVTLAVNEPSILRIAYLAAPTQNFLPELIYEFHQAYPHIEIKMTQMDALQIIQSASKKENDIYFSVMDDFSTVDDLLSKKIQSDSFCLVTRKEHPALQTFPLDYSKIASEPFVFFNPAHAKYMTDKTMKLCEKLGFKPRIKEIYNQYETMLLAIESGVGIAILPYRSRQYTNRKLAFTLLDIDNDILNIAVAWHKQTLNTAVPVFTEFFRTFIRDNPEVF